MTTDSSTSTVPKGLRDINIGLVLTNVTLEDVMCFHEKGLAIEVRPAVAELAKSAASTRAGVYGDLGFLPLWYGYCPIGSLPEICLALLSNEHTAGQNCYLLVEPFLAADGSQHTLVFDRTGKIACLRDVPIDDTGFEVGDVLVYVRVDMTQS